MALHPGFCDLLSAFAADEVRYLLVGGYAVALHARTQPGPAVPLDAGEIVPQRLLYGGTMSSLSPRSYSVVLEPDPDGGYVAIAPAFPGCYSQGETVEEALANAREAILLTIEDMEAQGEPIPDPSGEIIGKFAVGG